MVRGWGRREDAQVWKEDFQRSQILDSDRLCVTLASLFLL